MNLDLIMIGNCNLDYLTFILNCQYKTESPINIIEAIIIPITPEIIQSSSLGTPFSHILYLNVFPMQVSSSL